MKTIFPLLLLLILASCSRNCYHCELQTVCAVCATATDTSRFCLPRTMIADSLETMTARSFHCSTISGVQYGTQVCDNPDEVREMEAEHWACTK